MVELRYLPQPEGNELDCYVGLDVSPLSVAICVIDANGKHIFDRSAACAIQDVVACLQEVPSGQCRIGLTPAQ